MLTALLGHAVLTSTVNRFDLAAPLPSIAPVRIDKIGSGVGVAQQYARAHGLQARILWVDATANMNAYNSAEKIAALVKGAKQMGFNTISLDVKPIVGYTIYPGPITEQLTSWRGQTIPAGFDPVPIFAEECHKNGLQLLCCFNAFSEGHRMAKEQEGKPDSPFANGKPGPGYAHPDQQSVQVKFSPSVTIGGTSFALESSVNPTQVDASKGAIYAKAPTAKGEFVLIGLDRRVRSYSGVAPSTGEVVLRLPSSTASGALLGQLAKIGSVASFTVSSENQNQIPLMMNPNHPAVAARMAEVIRDFVKRYDVDGVLFDDRLRYTGMDGDFSRLTQLQFESEIGQKVNWPKDIYETTYDWNLKSGIRPGKYWDAWWEFRAKKIKNWMSSIRNIIKQERSRTKLGIYAGSWYGEYDNYGANYGSTDNILGFSQMTAGFRQSGFANLLDMFIGGCYYRVPTIFDAMVAGAPKGQTIEAGAQMINRAVNDETWAIAGISLSSFAQNPEEVRAALQASVACSQGVMVFDYSHEIEKFVPHLTRAFSRPAAAPYADPKHLTVVRKLKNKRIQLGYKYPPAFIQEGAPGIGH